METVLTNSPDEAAEFIRSGELVAFPTETVYGLGASLFNPKAIEKIFRAKQRPSDNPLIAHISSLSDASAVASSISDSARRLIHSFFPGALTIVLPKTDAVPLIATAGLSTVGIRMPRHELAQRFLHLCGQPVVAPSANRSGRPSPTTWEAVKEDLDGKIACILLGDDTEVGLESTVVDCSREPPVILRPGAVSLEQIRDIVPDVRIADSAALADTRSPGIRYKHYSPKAKVVLIERGPGPVSGRAAFIGTDEPANRNAFRLVRVVADVDDYARQLFSFFRECDNAGIETIFCQAVDEDGLGRAVMDRIGRAAK
jgi:L-threonylcarbamoyladenylate synthase